MTKLTDKIFHNEDAARAHFEGIRWPEGRVCFHCGTMDNSVLLKGKSTRPGLYKCRDCRKPFTATMGTIYERSHIPLHKWLLATHLMVSSKKGISALQLHRNLGFGSYRTAWFMAHRIREAMKSDDTAPMGSGGGDVFADETYFGRNPDAPRNRMAIRGMNQILTLVDRTTGRSTSMIFDGTITTDNLRPILQANIAKEARLITDDARHYKVAAKDFAGHRFVAHNVGEYVNRGRDDHDEPRSKASSEFSSAECGASISIAASSTCAAISLNLISATRTASPPDARTRSAPAVAWLAPSGVG